MKNNTFDTKEAIATHIIIVCKHGHLESSTDIILTSVKGKYLTACMNCLIAKL